MRNPIRFAFVVAVLSAASAFGQSLPAPASTQQPTPAPPAAAPVFDCYSINFAWGFQLSGKFIDGDGAIYRYRKTKQAWLPHDIVDNGARLIGDADLQAKYAEREKIGSVEAPVLVEKAALIDAAAKGKVVHEDGGARDAGSSSCHAYIRDAAKARYRDIELGSDGGVNDVRTKNDAQQAQDLLAWLKSVGVAR